MNISERHIALARAARAENVPPMHISIDQTLPDFMGDAGEHEKTAFYAGEAQRLARALQESLPRGTLHALFIELLIRKRNALALTETTEETQP